jgi:hypothetical protein
MTWAQFVIAFYDWWGTLTFCVSTLFVLAYGLSSPWWKSPFGKALMVMDLGVAVATFPSFLYFVFDINIMQNRAAAVVVILASSAITIAIGYRVLILWAVRREEFWRNLRQKNKEMQGPELPDTQKD